MKAFIKGAFVATGLAAALCAMLGLAFLAKPENRTNPGSGWEYVTGTSYHSTWRLRVQDGWVYRFDDQEGRDRPDIFVPDTPR